eukprot:91416-Chlamydomonas_euryale.AAC.8
MASNYRGDLFHIHFRGNGGAPASHLARQELALPTGTHKCACTTFVGLFSMERRAARHVEQCRTAQQPYRNDLPDKRAHVERPAHSQAITNHTARLLVAKRKQCREGKSHFTSPV